MIGYDDSGYLGTRLRELRHNPCFMSPAVAIMFLFFGVFMVTTLVFQAPTVLLGLLMAPILQRSSWFVQFLYAQSIGRWAHFLLMSQSKRKGGAEDKNRGFHSRTVEQRIEVVPGRLYIHPIPQWTDNLGYLVVCLPGLSPTNAGTKRQREADAIVAVMIDCGDVDATVRAIQLLRRNHYGRQHIRIEAILSTHKHHDHTGGNKALMSHELGANIDRVYAGAVEKVPCCTHPLLNGDLVELPSIPGNDMNELVEIEAVAVPSHTRGSIVYRMATKGSDDAEFVFAGDTMFSGGGGVPFESDIGSESEARMNKSNGNTFVRSGIGSFATERCFAEILVRTTPNCPHSDVQDRVLVFPGHEYTAELLTRQMQGGAVEACRWKNFAPKDFFVSASQLYVAIHRRSLPHNSGRLLTVPSTLRRELTISPHYRSMRKTGETVLRAINFWYSNFYPQISGEEAGSSLATKKKRGKRMDNDGAVRTKSSAKVWNLHADDIKRDIFTTVYSSDLDAVIDDLGKGRLSKKEAAKRLREMSNKLNEPTVMKRAIPNMLPSDKSIYKGVCGLVILGSPPSAMSISDSRRMRLPSPIDSNSDHILISKARLVKVLTRLGLLERENEISDTAAKIDLLWAVAKSTPCNGVADEESDLTNDEVELGALKWALFGLSANQPSFLAKMFCLPCSSTPAANTFPDHPAAKMKQKSGDLVSHDVLTCFLCRNATGYVDQTTNASKRIEHPAREETVSDEEGFEANELGQTLSLNEHE